MQDTDFETVLTWQGFLDNYVVDSNKENKNGLYKYGKIQLLTIIMNKIILFVGILLLIIISSRYFYLKSSFVSMIVLFLLFDIFIDETLLCIPLCKIANQLIVDIPTFKLQMFLTIEITDDSNMVDKEASKEEPSKQEPSKEEPSKEEPSKEEPSKEEPSKQEPSKQEPSKEEPSKEEPSKQEPSKQELKNKKIKK